MPCGFGTTVQKCTVIGEKAAQDGMEEGREEEEERGTIGG